MISSFRIQGYRKFTDFQLDGLSRINFFVGKNNVGKTTLLESVFGWACGCNLSPFLWTSVQRNQYAQNFTAYHIAENIVSAINNRTKAPFSLKFTAIEKGQEIKYAHEISLGDIFKDFVNEVAIETTAPNHISAASMNQQSQGGIMQAVNTTVANWEISRNGENKYSRLIVWPNIFIDNIAPERLATYCDINSHRNMDENRKLYVHLKRQNLIGKFVKEMQEVFPEIAGFDILPYQDNSLAPVSVQATNGEYYPLDTFGDGLRRMFQIIGALIFYHDGIMCIDEIDSTIHPEAQKELCHSLIRYARKYNVQLFVTTHNLEFIDNFLLSWHGDESFSDVDDIRIVSMKNVNNEVKTRIMTGKEAIDVRENFNLELR